MFARVLSVGCACTADVLLLVPVGCTCDVLRSGVTCSPPGVAAVTALKLSGQGLVGVFPNATVWRALPNLTTVDLSYNSISGSFTPLLSVGAALTSITLPNNALSGPLPTSEWMYCPNLTTIYLSNNQISGVLPAQIAQLTQLTWLAMFVYTAHKQGRRRAGTGMLALSPPQHCLLHSRSLSSCACCLAPCMYVCMCVCVYVW